MKTIKNKIENWAEVELKKFGFPKENPKIQYLIFLVNQEAQKIIDETLKNIIDEIDANCIAYHNYEKNEDVDVETTLINIKQIIQKHGGKYGN